MCLLRGCRANDCQSHRKCQKCGGKHHQSLCEQGSTFQPSANTDSNEASVPTTPHTTTAVAKTRNNILLQTARSKAYTADNQLVPVRVLLDSGSQLRTHLRLD